MGGFFLSFFGLQGFVLGLGAGGLLGRSRDRVGLLLSRYIGIRLFGGILFFCDGLFLCGFAFFCCPFFGFCSGLAMITPFLLARIYDSTE